MFYIQGSKWFKSIHVHTHGRAKQFFETFHQWFYFLLETRFTSNTVHWTIIDNFPCYYHIPWKERTTYSITLDRELVFNCKNDLVDQHNSTEYFIVSTLSMHDLTTTTNTIASIKLILYNSSEFTQIVECRSVQNKTFLFNFRWTLPVYNVVWIYHWNF